MRRPTQRQADPDDVVGIAGDAGDEGAAAAAEGEGAVDVLRMMFQLHMYGHTYVAMVSRVFRLT